MILTRCLTVEETVPIIAQRQYLLDLFVPRRGYGPQHRHPRHRSRTANIKKACVLFVINQILEDISSPFDLNRTCFEETTTEPVKKIPNLLQREHQFLRDRSAKLDK